MKDKIFNFLIYVVSAIFILIGILVLCIQPYIIEITNIDITPFGVFNIIAGIYPSFILYLRIMSKLSGNNKEKGEKDE